MNKRLPQVPIVDKATTKFADPSKLGGYSEALVDYFMTSSASEQGFGDPIGTKVSIDPFTVINAYTQYRPGPDFIPSIFPTLLRTLNVTLAGKVVGFPMIGCGIGGGDWDYVMRQMLMELTEVDVTVVIYE